MKTILGGLLLVLLFAAVCVRSKRVIRAAEGAEKTGRYIVKLQSGTSYERFQKTLEEVLSFSENPTAYFQSEGVFNLIDIDLPEESLDKVCMYGAYSGPDMHGLYLSHAYSYNYIHTGQIPCEC